MFTGVYFVITGTWSADDSARRALGWLALSLGVVTHYSGGPWALVALGLFSASRLAPARRAGLGLGLEIGAAISAVVIGGWLAWSWSHFELRGSIAGTSTVSSWEPQASARLLHTTATNLWHTVVPYPLRAFDRSLITQVRPLGHWRDDCFDFYPLNLFFAFGVAGLFAVTTLRSPLVRLPRLGLSRPATLIAVGTIFRLSIIVHTTPDNWGLMHISLQPLVTIGLAALAAVLPVAGPAALRLVGAGAPVDLALGQVLHHDVQGAWWDLPSLTKIAYFNVWAKTRLDLAFLRDLAAIPWPVTLALDGLLLSIAVRRFHFSNRSSPISEPIRP